MKLLLMIHGLTAGGAERVITSLADGLVARGHEVYLLTLNGRSDQFYKPCDMVKRICLDLAQESKGLARGLWANLHRIRTIHREVATVGADAVVSFGTTVNILALLACVGTGMRVFISERTNPGAHEIARQWRVLRHITYRRASALVVQTRGAAEWFRARMGGNPPVVVIANPVKPELNRERLDVVPPAPFALAVGRLSPEKGFDVLLRAFKAVAQQCASLNLAIAGEGPEAAVLEALAAECGISARVFFLGQVKPIRSLMRQAEMFVLSSRYEGFPNVLLEALAAGIPVIAADCPNGPREILGDGRFGLLVPAEDPLVLATAMVRVATNAELKQRLVHAAPRAIVPYQMDGIIGQWEDLLRGRASARIAGTR
jgi:glycosyltransferase involved in cell wall biosynthesis